MIVLRCRERESKAPSDEGAVTACCRAQRIQNLMIAGGNHTSITRRDWGRENAQITSLLRKTYSFISPSVSFADSSLVRGSLWALPRQCYKQSFMGQCSYKV